MAEPTLDELTTITLTHRERILLARALTIVAAMADALGDSTRELMGLWARVQPDGEAL